MPPSESRLQLVLNSLREYAFFTTDTSGIINGWYANAPGVLGWTAEEAEGQPISLIFTPEDRASGADREELDRARTEGRSSDERWHLKKGDERFWGNGMVYPLRDEADALLGYVKILIDETEEHLRREQTQRQNKDLEAAAAKRAAQDRAEEERWLASFDHAAIGLCNTSLSESRFLAANARLCEMLGYTVEQLRELTAFDITHPDDLDENRALFAELVEERTPAYYINKRLIRRDGSQLWCKVSVSLARDSEGCPTHTIAVVEDISARVQAEQALLKSNEELRNVNAELEQFAFVSSHDLQEPLRTINLYTQMFLRQFGSHADPVASQYAGYINDSVDRMQHLIEDLLEYSRVVHTGKHDQYRATPTDLNAALDDALNQLESQTKAFGAIITRNQLPMVKADAESLAQVFHNLISNALKFGTPGEPPRIHISAHGQGDDCVISVHDNGIGFDEKYAERIFGLFKRLHRSEYPGTGLGLAIAKRIILRYGGRIWAESGPAQGSTFYFTLPPL